VGSPGIALARGLGFRAGLCRGLVASSAIVPARAGARIGSAPTCPIRCSGHRARRPLDTMMNQQLGLDRLEDLGVRQQELLCTLPPLANALALMRVPGTALVDQVGGNAQIDQL